MSTHAMYGYSMLAFCRDIKDYTRLYESITKNHMDNKMDEVDN